MALTAENLKALSAEAAEEVKIATKDWETCSSAAVETLSSLDQSSLREVKSFAAPPQPVKELFESVLVCLGESDVSWNNSRKQMGNPPAFIEKLIKFDPATVDAQMIRKLDKYIDRPSFEMEKMKKVSKACAGVLTWVLAVHEFGSALNQ
mmetsp:Transcript_25558/g.31011  ORF Transcript_25558/g.31011 Transcript_25558/m.31011 type:complete len:150 (+) Transcript_25558:209-658(+)|eukprot:CAMPEP_0197848486 /NCGR_PEP_ID=MMETSP1438-20131217/8893_1 /TAXON_ID=1461541 /ORGANISM="Pterosperma sp., Strain CCMP1384" /LENGTH=149 /DNA_ID=CAMNT_0043460757 /DNA_START=207 /DNA_END=656 /DNA_ORIENTATION=+